MPLRVTPTAHGTAALDALADVVRVAKGGDALAPVTIVVPTNTAGVMARRALGRRGGAAAIDVLTLYRVAELLASPSLVDDGRRPVSTPVVDLAVQRALSADPGMFAAVSRHPSTVVALRDLYRELRLAGPAAAAALARTERGGEPSRVVDAVHRLLSAGWYDEGDLLARAASVAGAGVPGRFARMVLYLPQQMRQLEVALVRAISAGAEVVLLAGVTGDPDADAAIATLTAAVSAEAGPRPALAPVAPGAIGRPIAVVSTTDADDEVRIAVRAVVDAARAGTPFDRIAVLWPSDRPYARLVEHQLTSANVPWNGRPGTVAGERQVPRVLAELLDMDRRGLRRSELMHLLADVPARGPDGRPVPTAQWDRIGRQAAILREEDWDRRLPGWIEEIRERSPSLASAAEQLHTFVAELRGALGVPDHRRPWSEWVAWAHDRIERWFGRRVLDRLDDAERAAWELTQRVLDRLGNLDSLGEPVTRADFRAMFVAELEVAPARAGRIGDGVHVGALGGSAGLDVDLVVLLGAADGLLPPPPPIDPLVGDADRARAGLITADERASTLHRQFLAMAHTTAGVVVTLPRGDLRATAVHHPSRWVTSLTEAGVAHVRTVDSHAQGLGAAEFPVSPAEHRVRELWTRVRAADDVRSHPLLTDDPVLAAALRLRDARDSDRFTEFDGDLTTRRHAAFDRPVSPTRIEAWSRCPHAYFVQYVLGVQPIEEPDDILTLTALDRGTALHQAVDRLQRGVLDRSLPPPDASGWAAEHVAALERIGEEVADELEATGRTGRAAYWASERIALLTELAQWIEADRVQWNGRTVRSSERVFGGDSSDGDETVVLSTPTGRPIAFRGQIDRIDELPDGTLVVIDHKTGSAHPYTELAPDDPTAGGGRFQLAVYAAAAKVLLRRPDAAVRAEYAFFAKERFRRIGLTFDAAAWDHVATRLADVVDGIEGGVFPLRPEPPQWRRWVPCAFCEPDGLGTASQWAAWERKRHDPRLARWFADPQPIELEPA